MPSTGESAVSDQGLVPVPGFPFALEASPGLEERARQIGARCAAASGLLGEILGRHPQFRVLVLTQDDWPPGPLPYGMPHFRAGTVVVAGARSAFWRSFVPLLELAPAEAYQAAVEVYGADLDLSDFFDLLAVHELGHAFHQQSQAPAAPRWLQEVFANVGLHTYVAALEPNHMPVLQAFPQALTAVDPDAAALPFQTLRDFEANYSDMGGVNYGWYQCHFHVAAGRVHDTGGITALQQLWRRLVLPDVELAKALRREVDHEVGTTLPGSML